MLGLEVHGGGGDLSRGRRMHQTGATTWGDPCNTLSRSPGVWGGWVGGWVKGAMGGQDVN